MTANQAVPGAIDELEVERQGREAYLNGFALRDCPYDGEKAVTWEGGWIAAEEEDDGG